MFNENAEAMQIRTLELHNTTLEKSHDAPSEPQGLLNFNIKFIMQQLRLYTQQCVSILWSAHDPTTQMWTEPKWSIPTYPFYLLLIIERVCRRATTSSLEGQKRKMPTNNWSREEPRAGKPTVTFGVVQVCEGAVCDCFVEP